MPANQTLRFPGEDVTYRSARNELLAAEIELRRQLERTAALRRALPPGGQPGEDYSFECSDGDGTLSNVRMSELFEAGKDSLVLYSFMYPEGGSPCPMCCAFLDSFDGAAPHIAQKANVAVIAKASAATLSQWRQKRGWRHLRLLSSANCDYNKDYLAEDGDGSQLPMVNVFRKTPTGIQHFYASELFYAPSEEDQHPRHVDLLWPLWQTLDLTPEGRGNHMPSLEV